MIEWLGNYEDYIGGQYMIEVDKCDNCREKRIVFVLRHMIEFQYGDKLDQTIKRRIRFCVKCIREVVL